MSVSICLRPASSHSHSQGEKPSRIQYLFALTVLVCACLRPASSQQHSLTGPRGRSGLSVGLHLICRSAAALCLPAARFLPPHSLGRGCGQAGAALSVDSRLVCRFAPASGPHPCWTLLEPRGRAALVSVCAHYVGLCLPPALSRLQPAGCSQCWTAPAPRTVQFTTLTGPPRRAPPLAGGYKVVPSMRVGASPPTPVSPTVGMQTTRALELCGEAQRADSDFSVSVSARV